MSITTSPIVREPRVVETRVFNVERIRQDFPILKQKVHGKPLVYLDNAASTQKPQAVIDVLVRYYSTCNATFIAVCTI